MKYLEVAIEKPTAYIVPIGDVHVGDRNFIKDGLPKLKVTLRWCKENNARIFLNGDIFNVAHRNSKTSPFESDNQEYLLATEVFRDYKDLIVGALDGNHEGRMIDMFGVSPTQWLCRDLNIPYCGWSAVVRFKVGKRPSNQGNRYSQNFYFYFHHTTGGGGSLGSKLNRVTKLRDIVEGCDVYVGSHNHQLVTAPQEVFYPSEQSGIRQRQIWYVDAGSYVGWGKSYAEKGMMPPATLGSPAIKLFAGSHEKKVSIIPQL